MKEHLRVGIGLLAGVILWKGAVVAPDGKVTGTISPSSATTAGLKTGDQIELIERRRFRLDDLTDAARFLIVNRSGERILILNPNTPQKRP
jgi:hypothetical protein